MRADTFPIRSVAFASGRAPALPSLRGALRFRRVVWPGDVVTGSLASLDHSLGVASTLSAVPAGP
ncbi:MAG: hypothetical protein ACREM3_02330 [Candidatus Rokuibacteriota bacterium]